MPSRDLDYETISLKNSYLQTTMFSVEIVFWNNPQKIIFAEMIQIDGGLEMIGLRLQFYNQCCVAFGILTQ